MNRIVVASGGKGADVDVLGCAVAYAELLRLEGENSIAVVSDNVTASVTPSVKAWGGEYETEYRPHDHDEFVMVDISDPSHFAPFVNHEHILEVYDHRFFGHEKRWLEILGNGAHIERVGSCTTLIWEQVQSRGHANNLSVASKRLLFAAIISNTLNFKASVTHVRDHVAYEDLISRVDLPEGWIAHYFIEQEQQLTTNLNSLLPTDTHVRTLQSGERIAIGQLELWAARAFISQQHILIEKLMTERDCARWFVTLPSISEGKNYLFTTDAQTQELLQEKLSVRFINNTAETTTLLMRKEIVPMIGA